MTTINKSRNLWIILITIALIGISYLLYLNVYVSNNENRMIKTRYRVLSQIGKNITEKKEGYYKNAKYFMDLVQSDVEEIDSLKKLKQLHKRLINDKVSKKISIQDSLREVFDIIIKERSPSKNKNIDIDYVIMKESESEDNFYKRIKKDPYSISFIEEQKLLSNKIELPIHLSLKTSFDVFMEPLLRDDVFDGLIIIHDSTVAYNSLNTGMLLSPVDTLFIKSRDLKSGLTKEIVNIPGIKGQSINYIYSASLTEIEILNTKYKLFLEPVHINQDEWWYLGGLLKENTYNSEKRRLSPGIIIFLSLVLLIILLGMPVIKLIVMGSKEHLHTNNITSSALSVVLGSAFVLLFILYFSMNRVNSRNNDKQLKQLADTISDNFIEELKTIFSQLETYDSDFNITYQDDTIINKILSKQNDTDANIKQLYPKKYPFLDYAFWADIDGQQKMELNPFKKKGKLISIAKRNYFKNKDKWLLPGDKRDFLFMLESISSLTSGINKAAISKRSNIDTLEVIAITTRLHSVIDPVLPKDYGFCLIDETGKVWFHSDKNRNMHENFIDESNENNYLRAAIYSHIAKPINLYYYNRLNRAYIKPFENIPLFLLTFYDKKLNQSAGAQIITFTSLLITTLFVLLFIQIILLLLINRKQSGSDNINLIMDWSRPKVKYKDIYIKLILYNASVFVMLMAFLYFTKGYIAVFMIFTAIHIVFANSYSVINVISFKKLFSDRFIWATAILVFLLNISAFIIVKAQYENFILLLVFQLVLLLMPLSYKMIPEKFFERYQAERYFMKYIVFLFSLLLIISIIPTLKFFEIAYDQEKTIRLKHHQLYLTKKKENRNLELSKYYESIDDPKNEIQEKRAKLGIYTKFLQSSDFSDTAIIKSNTKNNIHQNYNYWDSLVCFIRPFLDASVVENKYLVFPASFDSSWSWTDNKNKLQLKYTSLTENIDSLKPVNRFVVSDTFDSNFLIPFAGLQIRQLLQVVLNLIFWIIVGALLFFFFRLIKFGSERIYSVRLIKNYMPDSFKDRINELEKTGAHIFVTNLSRVDKNTFFINRYKNNNIVKLDWLDIKSCEEKIKVAILEKKKRIFINNFGNNYRDVLLNKRKLKLLNKLLQIEGAQIIISSAVSHEQILSFYDEKIHETEKNKRASLELDYYLYKEILNLFVALNFPVIQSEREINETNKDKHESIDDFIDKELQHSDYLLKQKKIIKDYSDTWKSKTDEENIKELIISKILNIAAPYYSDLLNSCTLEEKYVLYDLADDMILNPKNTETIYALLDKGLLILKNKDQILTMNESFRRFFLSNVNKKDIHRIEKELTQTGRWFGLKTPLILIIIGLFIFIAIAKQDFLEDLNTLFVVIGGGIAILSGILGLLSKGTATQGMK